MYRVHIKTVLLFIISSTILQVIKCEFYTAVSEMGQLLRTEGEIVKTLEKYLEAEEERLEKMKWFSKQYSKLHELAKKDVEQFLSNPVNAYLLLKRLTVDWEAANNLMDGIESKAVIRNVTTHAAFPSSDDLLGAAKGLIRLQDVYLLDANSIAKGQIKGVSKSSELTAGDCFELAKQAFKAQLFNHTVMWMKESWNRVNKEKIPTADKINILEFMAYSQYLMHNYADAVESSEKILQIDPDNYKAQNNIIAYRAQLEGVEAKRKELSLIEKKQKPTETTDPPLEGWPDHLLHPSITRAYEQLCRGESLKTHKEKKKLRCYYTTNNRKYLFLQPVKVELLNLNPRIVMFYDVITEKETEYIKAMAAPYLSRATVNNAESGASDFADYRISKSTWLYEYMAREIHHLNRRVEEISGLDALYSEPLHVINYGIGGHYEPHFDFAEKEDKFSFLKTAGNRIATWIFYLTDVAAGGSTVFPKLGVEVKPVKRAAVFWHNLLRNGEGDHRTQHAACPVLSGSKWIANKWLHEFRNEFNRPCILNPSE